MPRPTRRARTRSSTPAAESAAPPSAAEVSRQAVQRAFAIHRALAEGEALSKPELAARFGVARRTVQRDLAALKREGAPLVYDRARGGHVYRDPNWEFRPPSLQADDQFALMVAENALAQYEGTDLHAGLRAAFERMGARLPEALRERHRAVAEAIHFGGLPPPRLDPDAWATLLLAIQARQVVQLDYARLGETPVTHTLHPYQLLVRDRDWFLVAHLPRRRKELLFYLPRVRAVRLQGAEFTPRAGFDAERFHRRGFNAMQGPAKPVNVELRFAPEVAELAEERPWADEQQVVRHRDGSASVRFRSAALFEIRRQVLRYEGRVRVTKPASLRRELAEVARSIAEAHGG